MLFRSLAVVSMVWGNLVAIQQTNVKRLLAYSSISQVGYVLVALAALSQDSATAALLALLDDPTTRRCVEAERAFLAELGSGCDLPCGASATVTDGAVEYHHTVVVPDALDDLPRLGVRLRVPAAFGTMRWYGRGPHENYPDRCRSAHLGTWRRPLDEPPYLIPQEFGLRCDCRWLELVGPRGRRLRIDVLDPVALHMSATRYSARTLTDCPHESVLRPDDAVEVHLDVAHRGLGSASCGPDVLPQYRITPGTYRFAYRLSVPRD